MQIIDIPSIAGTGGHPSTISDQFIHAQFTGQLCWCPRGCLTCGSRAPSDGNTSSQSGRPKSSGVRVAARFNALPVVSLHMAVWCPVLVRRTEAVGRLICSRCSWGGVVLKWCLTLHVKRVASSLPAMHPSAISNACDRHLNNLWMAFANLGCLKGGGVLAKAYPDGR